MMGQRNGLNMFQKNIQKLGTSEIRKILGWLITGIKDFQGKCHKECKNSVPIKDGRSFSFRTTWKPFKVCVQE